jgi:hypothetical protein
MYGDVCQQSTEMKFKALRLSSSNSELQNKRSERKRRSTANPHFAYPGTNTWGDLTSGGGKRARLHQAMLAAATAAAAEAAEAAAGTAEPEAPSPSPTPASKSMDYKGKGKAGGGILKRKSMMAGDRHRQEAEEEVDSRPDTPESDAASCTSSSSASSNIKNGSQVKLPS